MPVGSQLNLPDCLSPSPPILAAMAQVRIRSYGAEDHEQLVAIQRACFPPPFPAELLWTAEQIACHARVFAAGALCAEVAGLLVGSATAHVLRWDPGHPDPAGDTLYGVDIAVLPAWRGRGVARVLYQARYDLVRRLRLRRFLAGSRLAGYHHHQQWLSPEAYADAVVAGRLQDPVITPQLRAGLLPVRVVRGYLPDAEAADCALLMQYPNPEIP